MYETIRIVGKIKPKIVVWENVKNILSKKHKHNFDSYLEKMEQLGYKNFYKVLNAKDFGIPQNRERVYTISILEDRDFDFPKQQELKLRLKDILEDQVDEKYYLSEEKCKGNMYQLLKQSMDDQNSVYQWRRKYVRKSSNNLVPTLTANMGEGRTQCAFFKF